MLIECDNCPVRGSGCAGCLVTVLYEPPAEVERLDRDELWAVETLARAGFEVELVHLQPALRPLRLVGGPGRAA